MGKHQFQKLCFSKAAVISNAKPGSYLHSVCAPQWTNIWHAFRHCIIHIIHIISYKSYIHSDSHWKQIFRSLNIFAPYVLLPFVARFWSNKLQRSCFKDLERSRKISKDLERSLAMELHLLEAALFRSPLGIVSVWMCLSTDGSLVLWS